MTEQVVAYVEPALMSNGALVGLVNVSTSDGQHYFDLTLGQLRSLADRGGWRIVKGEPVEGWM